MASSEDFGFMDDERLIIDKNTAEKAAAAAWYSLKVAELNCDEALKGELLDILDDYGHQAEVIQWFMNKYEIPEKPRQTPFGYAACPFCGHRVNERHTHCHWCGKLIRPKERTYLDGKSVKLAKPESESGDEQRQEVDGQ